MSQSPNDQAAAPTRRGWLLVLIGALLGVLLIGLPMVAIGYIGPGWGGERTVEVRGEHIAFAVDVPRRVSAIDDLSLDPDGECPIVEYEFGSSNGNSPLAVLGVGKDCAAAGQDRLMNGYHGNYRTLADVPDPIDVTEVATRLGTAQVFVQEYAEHTNFSRRYEEPVAIVTLDEPIDPQFPTLLLRSEAGKLSRDRFTQIVASLDEPHP